MNTNNMNLETLSEKEMMKIQGGEILTAAIVTLVGIGIGYLIGWLTQER